MITITDPKIISTIKESLCEMLELEIDDWTDNDAFERIEELMTALRAVNAFDEVARFQTSMIRDMRNRLIDRG